MRLNYYFYCLFINLLFISAPAYSQTINFDETWKEFLFNNKISNMSELYRPDKNHNPVDYAKYLLMNTNSDFCQSEMEEAERLMAEIKEIDADVRKSIPGFAAKRKEVEKKMEAYHNMDAIWKRFLLSKEVNLEELEAVKGLNTSCERSTLAKNSYMKVYHHFCHGEVSKAKTIFENRTLKLTENTSLRVENVEGLASEIAKMKKLFQNWSRLEIAWKTFVETGVSSGFDIEFPIFLCNPIPNLKEFVLKGAADLCNSGPIMLDKFRKLQSESGITPQGKLRQKVNELERTIKQNETKVSVLNKAWEAFIPDNKLKQVDYGYELCSKEQLIRAYIMDGFGSVCLFAEESLLKIDSLQMSDNTPLEEITMVKIDELTAFYKQHYSNGVKIDRIWNNFVAQDDNLYEDYQSTDIYCDYVQLVKDWTMKGLSGTCEEGIEFLEKIEEINRTFDWVFYEELECRVQKLRFNVWDCRYQALRKLAQLEASPESIDERLNELMEEYGMAERPKICSLDK